MTKRLKRWPFEDVGLIPHVSKGGRSDGLAQMQSVTYTQYKMTGSGQMAYFMQSCESGRLKEQDREMPT